MNTKPKTVKITPRIASNDIKTKGKQILRMLKQGKTVRISVQFKGREIDNVEVGSDKLQELWDIIADEAHMSVKPLLKEKELFMVVQAK